MSFAFSESEWLSDQMTHARFMRLLHDPDTRVLAMKETTNSYGEFLFVTLAGILPSVTRPTLAGDGRLVVTFWGLGFHDARECYLLDLWRFHEAQLVDEGAPALNKVTCLQQIEARRRQCETDAANTPAPSNRAAAFAFFAEMGDEDGALAELEDLEALGVDVEGLFDE